MCLDQFVRTYLGHRSAYLLTTHRSVLIHDSDSGVLRQTGWRASTAWLTVQRVKATFMKCCYIRVIGIHMKSLQMTSTSVTSFALFNPNIKHMWPKASCRLRSECPLLVISLVAWTVAGLRPLCVEFTCSILVCVSSVTQSPKTYMCRSVGDFYFNLGISLRVNSVCVLCDGLEACPGCVPCLHHCEHWR